MTVPKVKRSEFLVKIVWREPSEWENAKICISLKYDAIFMLLIEKKCKLQVIKWGGAHQGGSYLGTW